MPAPRITWDWRDEDDPDSHPVRRGMDRTKERQPRTMIHGCRDQRWSAGVRYMLTWKRMGSVTRTRTSRPFTCAGRKRMRSAARMASSSNPE